MRNFAIIFLCVVLVGCSSATSWVADGVFYEPEPGSFNTPSEMYDHARTLFDQEKFSEAKELFRQYVAQNPDSNIRHIAMYYLANCHQETGDTEEALRLYHTIIDRYPQEEFWIEYASKRIEMIKESKKSLLLEAEEQKAEEQTIQF